MGANIFTPAVEEKRSRLESLPPELLLVIFERLHRDCVLGGLPQLTHPLSRTLAPYLRRNLYRRVTKLDGQHLQHFCQVVTRYSLHSNLLSLLIQYPKLPTNRLDEETAFQFFSQTDQLQVIDAGNPHLSIIFLSPRFSSVCLRNVRVLAISASSTVDLARVVRFRRMYCKLETLFFHHMVLQENERAVAPEWIELEPENVVELPPDKVKFLSLKSDTGSMIPSFFASFQSLTGLRIQTLISPQDWSPILRAINPEPFIDLCISTAQISPTALVLISSRFPNLAKLEILTSQFTHPFFANLHRLPNLTTLMLDGEFSQDNLVTILSGPTKIQSLLSLIILKNEAKAVRGPSAGDPSHRYQRNVGGFGPAKGWEVPRWSSAWPRVKAEWFLDLANEAGVDPGTHLHEAMSIEDDFQEERDLASDYSMTEEGERRMAEEEQPEIEVMRYANIDWGF